MANLTKLYNASDFETINDAMVTAFGINWKKEIIWVDKARGIYRCDYQPTQEVKAQFAQNCVVLLQDGVDLVGCSISELAAMPIVWNEIIGGASGIARVHAHFTGHQYIVTKTDRMTIEHHWGTGKEIDCAKVAQFDLKGNLIPIGDSKYKPKKHPTSGDGWKLIR